MTSEQEGGSHQFSGTAEELLVRAGWRRGRRVDVALWRNRFAAYGIDMHQAAEDFLEEFGALSLRLGLSLGGNAARAYELDPLHFDEGWQGWSEVDEEYGCLFFPVGYLVNDFPALLAVDENANLYSLSDDVWTFGPMPGGLEKLLLMIEPQLVPGDSGE